ncbi:MAG: ribosome assembly cofactor RimP [Oscillospiraceae bacterium]|jgi:ribosome maturation factor RimP|nr:ribosome assembly cofactor RimP [Oscillospiraceae bacterium]
MMIEEKTRALVEPLLTEAGFALWDVIFEKEGAMNYLRILFDKDGGLNDEDCAQMITPLNQLMDKQDFIVHIDILEAGSPGLTRRLRHPGHFTQNIGNPIRVMKRGDKGKTDVIYGTLETYDPGANQISLKTETETIVLDVKNCLRINLDF